MGILTKEYVERYCQRQLEMFDVFSDKPASREFFENSWRKEKFKSYEDYLKNWHRKLGDEDEDEG